MINRNIDGIKLSTYFILLFLISVSCSDQTVTLSGNIDYLGDSELIIEYPKLHYKYSETPADTVSVTENGDFSYQTRSADDSLIHIRIEDRRYPIAIRTGDLTLTMKRADFPQNIDISGYPDDLDEQYDRFLKAVEGMDSEIEEEIEKMKVGGSNRVIALAREKMDKARTHLDATAFDWVADKTAGEYLVYRIRSVEYDQSNFEDYNADSVRSAVVQEAEEMGLFTLSFLKAQRAGIRDFAHYYSRTFGIYDSVEQAEGQELSEYDIKRLAFRDLNDKKDQLLAYFENKDAKAYADLYYLAERIGEQPLSSTDDYYTYYLSEYENYPRYTEFIEDLYRRMESVSPGNPAIGFSFPDAKGNMRDLDDFRGRYVLLDFWAGWCQPCLDEFEDMRKLYDKYPRSSFEILGISTEVDSLIWRSDIERFENPWPQLYGGNGFELETFRSYQGNGIPFYVLVGPEGTIVRYNDIRPSYNLESILDSLITSENE